MNVKIRPAVAEDAEGIALSFLDSAAHHAGLDPERYEIPSIEPISARYRAALPRDGESITLVAELDSGEIVGFLDARLERSPDPMHREMLFCDVSEIGVRLGHRSQGIGERLLQAAEDWGRRHGARFASLEYHVANTRASVFYQERMGYRPAAITALKRL